MNKVTVLYKKLKAVLVFATASQAILGLLYYGLYFTVHWEHASGSMTIGPAFIVFTIYYMLSSTTVIGAAHRYGLAHELEPSALKRKQARMIMTLCMLSPVIGCIATLTLLCFSNKPSALEDA